MPEPPRCCWAPRLGPHLARGRAPPHSFRSPTPPPPPGTQSCSAGAAGAAGAQRRGSAAPRAPRTPRAPGRVAAATAPAQPRPRAGPAGSGSSRAGAQREAETGTDSGAFIEGSARPGFTPRCLRPAPPPSCCPPVSWPGREAPPAETDTVSERQGAPAGPRPTLRRQRNRAGQSRQSGRPAAGRGRTAPRAGTAAPQLRRCLS